MVILTEQIEIPASYEKMEAWAANFEEEFVNGVPTISNAIYITATIMRKQDSLSRDCYGAGLRCDRHDYGMQTG